LPNGKIEDGKYTIKTGGKPGAPPGKYKVTVSSTRPSDPKNEYSIPISLIEKSSTDATTTTIKKEVKADAPAGHYDLTVNPAK
jgi:hypothetical protein